LPAEKKKYYATSPFLRQGDVAYETILYFCNMPTHRTIPYNHGVFSITFTCAGWLPLIEIVSGYDLVYNWFDVLKAQGHKIIGYVIMPNHVHAMIAFVQNDTSINTIIGNGKRFMAYAILERLDKMGAVDTLVQLSKRVEPGRLPKNKKHDVWELSFDWKLCTTEIFIKQKLDYYHKNPCSGKWLLAASPVDYVQSSAYFYYTGIQGIYPVMNYREMVDMVFQKE
jgi:REP element-mobilizing transposase RayT